VEHLTRTEPARDWFAFLWAFALLSHQVGYGMVRVSLLDTALTFLAVAVMLLPGWPLLLGILAAVHVATIFHHLPGVYNHWYFAGLVSLSLWLACMVAGWDARRSGAPPTQQGTWIAFAPAARWSLLLLYFLSGFHKLNGDFFNPEVSCASVLYQALSGRLGGLPNPPVMGSLAIAVTVAVELGLPALLLIPRLRGVGVGVGALFHLVMAAAGYVRFSAAGVALLTLFLPGGLPILRSGHRIIAVAVLLPGVALASEGGETLFLWATVLLCLALLGLTVAARRALPVRWPAAPGRLAAAPMLGPALVLLSGIAPYLGLGTDRAFSMYSNLRTEGGVSNHLVVPAALQMFSYQRDLIRILRSSDPELERLAAERLVIPFAELRTRLTEAVSDSGSPVSLSYLRGTISYETSSVMGDSVLDLPVSPLRIKFLRFRPVEAGGPRRCGV